MAKRKGGNLPVTASRGSTQPDTQKAITVQEVMRKIGLTAFSIDFVKSPEDALSSYRLIGKDDLEGQELNSKMLAVWEQIYFERIMNDVIEQTGADPEQLRDPQKRTPEQQRALSAAAKREQAARKQLLFESKYYYAFKTLDGAEGNYHSKHDGDPEYIGLKEQAILYYFASHSLAEIDPIDRGTLTPAQKKELIDLFYRLDNFYLEEADQDKDDESPEPITLYRFIEAENLNTDLPVIITKKIQDILYPLDKVNSSFWGLIPGEQTTLKAESDEDSRKGKEANIYVLLDFDFDKMKETGITISRPLTSYDKRVFIASANLKEQGHDTVTTTQVYEAMGNRGRPSAQQRQKILKSIETMSLCRVTLDNSEEAAMYTKYDKVKRTFYLLPTTIDKGYVNGLIVDDAINIIELPRLFIFAKKRGQFASTPIALLESPISQTEANLLLEDYLLTRISRMKNAIKRKKQGNTTILLDTLYKNCNISDKHKRSRAAEKIDRLLQHYKKQGFIKGYKLTAKSIDIDL